MGKTVAVVGLGYVGLPLALAFGRVMKTIGFDVDKSKIDSYNKKHDPSDEMTLEDFSSSKDIIFTTNSEELKKADFIVVAVPTPINKARHPDLKYVIKASELTGENLSKGATVIYESTVYPGLTEDICIPILEKFSKLKCGIDFKVGYSPERINPGDKEHKLENIVKVVSGQDEETLESVAALYNQIIKVGVYKAPSIKVAESAKVIENTQRDLNIALMNELSMIFEKMDIDTEEVLKTAETKWNFLPFRPGLVGGHCIGVDPYYITYKAELLGYHPKVILAGRETNDHMGKYIAEQTVKHMIMKGSPVKGANVLVMGLTFKENCSDLRNSRVIDVIKELRDYGINPKVWDPVAEKACALKEYGISLIELDEIDNIEAIIAAVAHDKILKIDLKQLFEKGKIKKGIPFMDVKSIFPKTVLDELNFDIWRL